MNKRFPIYIVLLFLAMGCASKKPLATEGVPPSQKAKNIILLIGDGMGLAQLSIPYYFSEDPINFQRLTTVGLQQNKPVSHKITDSAAGATAFSTGKKTFNGAIGVRKDSMPQKTILEMAADQGLKTGLVSTSSITHATPASFYAHVPSRKMEEEIAAQLVLSDVDYFAGGGQKYFFDREDGQNFWDALEREGFAIDTFPWRANKPRQMSKRHAILPADDAMPMMTEGRGNFLAEAAEEAIKYLSQSENGFFLMVEGSQIDWGGHANDAEYLIQETIDFDKAVGKALDFAKRDGETLVVVTADHETGGFALSSVEVRRQRNYAHIEPTFSTGGHTANFIPVLAKGPGEQLFSGFMENNDIFGKLLAGYGWEIDTSK